MKPITHLTVTNQLISGIKEAAAVEDWSGNPPSVRVLARKFGVSPNTVMKALRALDSESFFTRTEHGRIVARKTDPAARKGGLRICILTARPRPQVATSTLLVLLEVVHRLETSGHTVFFMRKSRAELGADINRLAEAVAEARADAWILAESPRETLEWFLEKRIPLVSFGGRSLGLPVLEVGQDAGMAMTRAVETLMRAGHQRIALIAPGFWNIPKPGILVNRFLDALASGGVTPGKYNVPGWEESPEGLRRLLDSLFRLTPPTAMIFADYEPFLGTLGFLAKRGLRVPEDISLITMESDPSIRWMTPEPARFATHPDRSARRIVKWAGEVMAGANPGAEAMDFCEFMPGETVGPVRSARTGAK